MFCHQAMQLSDLAGGLDLVGEAKYISIFDTAIGLDELATEPVDIWATKSVHGITPIPETHSIEGAEFDANRNGVLRRNVKSQIKGGIAPGDAAKIPSLGIARRSIYSFPICSEDCNEPYTYFGIYMSDVQH